MLIPLRWRTDRPFIPLWEKSVGGREQPLAPYTTYLPDIFEAVIYLHCPCPTRSGLTVRCFCVEIEGLSSRELISVGV